MKCYVYPADAEGCGYHRMVWPAEQLQKQGHDVTVIMPEDREIEVKHHGDEVTYFGYPHDADVVVMQRTTHRLLVSSIRYMRKRGVAVVIDIDDDLGSISPTNPAYWALHPRGERSEHLHSWRHLTACAREATMVTVSTPALLDIYAPHGRGRVLPNYLSPQYYGVQHRDSDLVGYPGAIHSHSDDVRVVGTAVNRFTQQGGKFIVAGDPTGVGRAFMLEKDPETLGVVPLSRWPRALASLGIGIAPLVDSKFNKSKSWLKPLELAAAGVPWIGSPRAEYTRLHKMGCGILATKPKDWLRAMKQLAANESRRQELSEAGRAVAAQLKLEDHAEEWWETWRESVQIQQDGDLSIRTTRSPVDGGRRR